MEHLDLLLLFLSLPLDISEDVEEIVDLHHAEDLGRLEGLLEPIFR